MAALNFAFDTERWVPNSRGRPGGEGTSLPDEKYLSLMGALAGYLRSYTGQQMHRKAKVIVQNTFLTSFQASLGGSQWSQSPSHCSICPTRINHHLSQEAIWGHGLMVVPAPEVPTCPRAQDKMQVSRNTLTVFANQAPQVSCPSSITGPRGHKPTSLEGWNGKI